MNEAGLVRAGPPSARVEYTVSETDVTSIESALASRIARLLPKLARAECGFAAAHVRAGLLAIVRKEAERVQSILDELVSPMPQAARDQPIGAAEAVELLLPVLTDADLLLLLATTPSAHSAPSHATRPIIQALLAHDSACIREAMLDALVGAKSQPGLGAPALSGEASRSLREIAAGHALAILAPSAELPAQLWSELVSRLDRSRSNLEGNETVLASIRALKTSNALTEATLLEAARLGHSRRVAAILAMASGTSLDAVDRASGLRGAKALVALAWKSGFTMQSAVAAQTLLGQLSPSQILFSNADGSFPLTRAEMEWQIELLCAPGHADTRQAA